MQLYPEDTGMEHIVTVTSEGILVMWRKIHIHLNFVFFSVGLSTFFCQKKKKKGAFM
jgi:hypothetical protein